MRGARHTCADVAVTDSGEWRGTARSAGDRDGGDPGRAAWSRVPEPPGPQWQGGRWWLTRPAPKLRKGAGRNVLVADTGAQRCRARAAAEAR